jgi:uncharacterized protein (DUF302 family)
MASVNMKKQVEGTLDEVIQRVTQALQKQGFGILSRIDFHAKIKEKLSKDVNPTVILGACHPQLAFEAFQISTDVASLMPCNAVVMQKSSGVFSVEFASAEALLSLLPDKRFMAFGKDVDLLLKNALMGI